MEFGDVHQNGLQQVAGVTKTPSNRRGDIYWKESENRIIGNAIG